ncbi:UNVERIFIED_CONTAM: hypothetical protein Scaly_2435200 [Sesamum calycinum]|uniref:Uncharacterized protein n=1 Tax=Sesamum calycinum TaxID=2727403 RepID=A0AAW2M2I1_9LAMI
MCEWICGLKFPDGYASNLARCVDMMELRMHGMKSHGCHVFLQKLIPIAFREMLPEHVWSVLIETECHNIGKSTMNYGVCFKSSSYTDEENDFYGIIEEIIQLTYPLISNLHIILLKYRSVDPVRGMKEVPKYKEGQSRLDGVCKIKARRVLDESKWTETFAYQPEEVVPVPVVATDNEVYNLCDPNGLQVVVDLSMAQQHAVGTSRRQVHENDDENKDKDEDNSWDDKTDDDEYEPT